MSEPRWKKPLSVNETITALSIAVCALDKLAEYTDEDTVEFGDFRHFAKTALDVIYTSENINDKH